MRRKSYKIKAFAALIILCLFFASSSFSLEGMVLCVNEDENFIFIDLGAGEVSEGDRVEIYRDSERIGIASVKRAMGNMSEASIIKRAVRIDIGDSVMVTKSLKAVSPSSAGALTISHLKEKVRQLEREAPLEDKLKGLEEAEDFAERTFKAQLGFLEESEKKVVRALDKKLETLKEKKAKTQTKMETKIASLKHAKESIDRGLVPAETVQDSTLEALEDKLKDLERSKKETLADLKKEIEMLEVRKVEVEAAPEERAVRRMGTVPFRDSPHSPEEYVYDDENTLTLEECLSTAMGNHLPLKIAKKQLALAEMRVLEAGRKMGPSVTAKWEMSDGQVGGRYYDGRKMAFEAKQPVFYGGELLFSFKQSKVNLEIVRNDYDRIKNDLILEVKKAYYNLDKAEKAAGIQEELYDSTTELYGVTRKGYDAGVISQVELLKVSSQHNQTDFQFTSAKEDTSIANLILQQSMNVDRTLKIASLAGPKIIELGLQDCFDLAGLNRPEIKISRLSLEHYDYEKKIMEARAKWPRVDILGMYGNVREDNISYDSLEGLNPRSLGPEYYVGTTVSVPMWGNTLGYSFTKEKWQPVVRTTQSTKSNAHELSFKVLDKLEDFSALNEAEIEYMRSKDEMNKKQKEITLEVKEAFFKYKKSVFMMNVAESKLEFQEKQTNITDIRRELGDMQYSDVIEEMIKLAEERFSRIQAISDYYVAVASLNKAVGLDSHFEI